MSHNSPNTGNQYTRVAPGKIIGQDNQSAEIDELILDIAQQASLMPRGKTINADMFPAKAKLLALSESRAIESQHEIYRKLWEDIGAIERVIVMIPVSYSTGSKIIRIPKEDEEGKVYSVSATPFNHIEKVFQKHKVYITKELKERNE